MFSINFNLYAPTGINYGPNITAIGEFSPGGKSASQNSISYLKVPWRDIAELPNTSSFLSWHTAMSKFAGRDNELEELTAWAEDGRAVSARFVIGEGGTGKSRLGAEFAEILKKKGWEAGFLNIRTPQNIPMSRKGTLLIVDYPEEHHAYVRELLVALTELDKSQKIRVLFLTRAPWSEWEMRVGDCNAYDVVDLRPVQLGRLEGTVAHTLYTSTLEKVSDIEKTNPPPLSEAALNDWLNLAPENDRALFIIAAAVHSALNPADEVVQYTGSKVMQSLVDRERFRLRRQAEANNEADQDAYCRLIAMTAIAGDVDIDLVVSWVSNEGLNIGVADSTQVQKNLEEALLMRNGVLPAPGPDLFAAAFTWTILGSTPKTAPELVWAAIEPDVESGLERLARLCHDIEYTLGVHGQKLGDWLKEAVDGKPERCVILEPEFHKDLPSGMLEAAIITFNVVLDITDDIYLRINILNSLSNHQLSSGDFYKSLNSIQKAVNYCCKLYRFGNINVLPLYASSLHNLSNVLSFSSNRKGSLYVIRKAIKYYRVLVHINKSVYLPYLVKSLNNLSIELSHIGMNDEAIVSLQECEEINRILVKENPNQYLPDLAMCLVNLSNRSADNGETDRALKTIQESEKIYRKLSDSKPGLYRQELAKCLNNLSIRLIDTNDTDRAMIAIKEALSIRRGLASFAPDRYNVELAESLLNLSILLSEQQDHDGALEASKEASDLLRILFNNTPNYYITTFIASLNALYEDYSNTGNKEEAVKSIKEAFIITKSSFSYRKNCNLFEYGRQISYLAHALLDAGLLTEALETISESIDTIPFKIHDASANILSIMANSLYGKGKILYKMKSYPDALLYFNKSINIIEVYNKRYPSNSLDCLKQELLLEIERTKEMLG